MSISSANRKAGPYSCNGATVAFPFAFKVFSDADVRVVLTDANAVESDLVLGTNYTVALNADQDANPGGTVTTTATYATGYLVTLTSQVQALQPVTLTNQGAFYPRVINDALDRVTIMVQQLAEQVSRAVKTSISSSTSPDSLISTLLTAVSNALTYSNNASNSATAAAGSATAAANSATAAANSATAAGNTPVAVPTHAATSKNTPADADEIPLIDSTSSWTLAKLTWANLKAGIWSALGPLIMAGTGKATPVDADYIAMADSAASNTTKSLSWANIKATLKTYFDTLYAIKIGTVSMVRLNTANGYGSTNTMIRRFANVVVNQGTDITYTDSATLGASFTINTSGVYSISYVDNFNGTSDRGITLNTANPTTAIGSVPISEILSFGTVSINYQFPTTWTGFLSAGSVIRAHAQGVATGGVPNAQHFTISRVS